MTKSYLYRLFGFGKIPAAVLPQLTDEGILLQDEGIKGSTTYIDFRAPGRYSNWKRQWYTASIVLTKHRLIAWHYSHPIIDVRLDDERFHDLRFSLEKSDTLVIAFEAGLFRQEWSGRIEYRFRTEQVQGFLEMLLAERRGTV